MIEKIRNALVMNRDGCIFISGCIIGLGIGSFVASIDYVSGWMLMIYGLSTAFLIAIGIYFIWLADNKFNPKPAEEGKEGCDAR